ncbi:hypothetical protein [Paenibacillus silvisoli]|uniref:hypothetical protein n=1 Tax=Paenibacillus silvisoli TaxID=3110539 RepID=UPI0028051B05|nr:hypothetical protein [Paenibacillus silvisoli]
MRFIVLLCLLVAAGCSEGAETNGSFLSEGTPLVWIYYDHEKYVGTEVYAEKPAGIISTQTVTKEGDYEPNKEIFRDSDATTFYIQDGDEWTAFEKEK